MKILKPDFGRALSDTMVEQSTIFSSQALDSIDSPTDISLYKLASQYAELKKIAGYTNVTTRTEYEIFYQEANQQP